MNVNNVTVRAQSLRVLVIQMSVRDAMVVVSVHIAMVRAKWTNGGALCVSLCVNLLNIKDGLKTHNWG